jgi:transposase InsO family protein
MALKVVSLEELRLQVLLESERTGETVAEVCLRHGISRASYYRYRRRYLQVGVPGLESRSRVPRSSPARIAAWLEVEICSLRRRHPRWGARRIRAELRRAGIDPPAISTVHQALRRNHLVAPQPPRKPNARLRFEREVSNDLWQIDATQVRLAGGGEAWIVDCLDDHARFCLSVLACVRPTGDAAWECFTRAAAAYGLPRQLLSDNGSIFTGRLLGTEVAFERQLVEASVELIHSRPYHPQTLGKLERFHRTLKEWLGDEGPALDLEHLQLLLERFRCHYNEERPHQGIADQTPAERYTAGFADLGAAEALASASEGKPSYPARSIVRKVASNGVFCYRNVHINIGLRYAGARVRIIQQGELVHVHYGSELVRSLAPDPAQRYQRKERARRTPHSQP